MKLFEHYRKIILVASLKCTKCGHEDKVVFVTPSGPHRKALCCKCGAYLRFLKASEGVPIRKSGEDKEGSAKDFYLVWAIKDNQCAVAGAYFDQGQASRHSDALKGRGYKSGVDFIPSDRRRVMRGDIAGVNHA